MSDEPVNADKPKKVARRKKMNGAHESPPAPVNADAPVVVHFTPEQAKELASIAIQATRFGPNPGFLQGQPIDLVRQAVTESMPPDWREKGAHEHIAQLHPSLQVILLTYFAAYWNLGYRVGLDHGKREAAK